MSKYVLVFFAAIMLAAACTNHIPGNVLPQEQMMKILWQMSVADGVYQSDTSRQTRTHLKDSLTVAYGRILSDNKITPEAYRTSLKYYESQPELMMALLDTTFKYGTKIKDSFSVHYRPAYHSPVVHPSPPPVRPAGQNLPKPLLPHDFIHRRLDNHPPK